MTRFCVIYSSNEGNRNLASMIYKSENIEKLKKLSAIIDEESTDKNEILGHLKRIYALLEKPRCDKKAIKIEISDLIAKIS